MALTQIAVYGAGGFGQEVVWLAHTCNLDNDLYEVVGFIDDDKAIHGSRIHGIQVMGLQETFDRFPDAKVVGGIGSPRVREHVIEKSAKIGFGFATIIHPRVERSQWIEIGGGTVICAGNILTVNIVLGRHTQINLDCTIGHHVVMEDFATLAPGVHISGYVRLGKRVYVGTGAVIINGTQEAELLVGDDTVIGAGACVTKSIPERQVVVGVPARPMRRQ